MIELVIGQSASGKSEYAEDRIIEFGDDKNRFYLATMSATDSESKKKIQKHIDRRCGMQYETLEKSKDIADILDMDIVKNTDKKVLLIEDLTNLVSGEMFVGTSFYGDVYEKIANDIKKISEHFDDIVIVSGDVMRDSSNYDKYTKCYINQLSLLNNEIAKISDKVTEVVFGINVKLK